MKPIFLSLLFIIFTLDASAQDPMIEWQNTIGGSRFDAVTCLQQTTDGGYIIGGHSESAISGDRTEASRGYADYWVIKLDSTGNIIWQKAIGGDNYDILSSIQQTTDGGYILGGTSESEISGDKTEPNIDTINPPGLKTTDYWVIKLGSTGNIIWQNTIGGLGDEILRTVQQTSDGGYILGGESESGSSGDKTEANQDTSANPTPDYWVIKLDAVGNIVWQNTIGGDNQDYLFSLQQTADGGYIVAGTSSSNISGDKTERNHAVGNNTHDIWVLKLDAAGNVMWQNTIGGSQHDNANGIQQTPDGGYILGGFSYSGISGDKTEASISGSSDYWVLKLDGAGNILWQNTIGGNANDGIKSLDQTSDGGYILGGYSQSGISGDKTEPNMSQYAYTFDYWIVKINSAGTVVWDNTIGGDSMDFLGAIQQTSDGGYILGGYSDSDISRDKTEPNLDNPNTPKGDYWVIKLKSDTYNISGQLLTETGTPVPGVSVVLSGDESQIDITDTTGNYSFIVHKDGTYTITPAKSNDSIPNNGVTLTDVLLMRRHLLGLGALPSPYKIIAAAEVNAAGDTTITTQDILFTRSLILGNITSFPNNRLWQFVPSDYVFPDNAHPFPFPSTRTYTNITTNQTGQDFISIKLGDVNESWDANTP